MKQYTEFIASKIAQGKWDKEETTTWSFKNQEKIRILQPSRRKISELKYKTKW